MIRKILHVDMDAFYASVEQRDDPSLRGRPVAVGGSSKRGVVAAASYEARAYGVRSAMPSVTAARRCPELVFIKPRFAVYQQVSKQIREVFRSYTPLVEPLSLDEAYLDVTESLRGPPSGTLIARMIKREIREKTGLTASAGVSYNKFLAKVASAAEKPDGLTVIEPQDARAFIDQLSVERFFGVGPVTAARMHEAGIRTGRDLYGHSQESLIRLFGKAGRYYHKAAQGLDDRRVQPHRLRKSVGAERTFSEDISDVEEMKLRLRPICEEVARRMAKSGLVGHTVTLKVKRHDFRIMTRRTTLADPVRTDDRLYQAARTLLAIASPDEPVRLLGVTVSKLRSLDDPEDLVQLTLPLEED